MSIKTNYIFLIGAPKSGTSSVARMLDGRSDVAFPSFKEPAYFTDFTERPWGGRGSEALLRVTAKSWDEYEAYFAHQPDAPWRIDASTDYLSCPVSAERIAAFRDDPGVGQVKVAVILRDPVARAISEYQHTVRDRLETRSLKQAIEREDQRLAGGYHPLFGHVMRGCYASQLARYRALFDDILILDYHRLREGSEVIDQLTDWAGLERVQAVEMKSMNRSHVYRLGALNRALHDDSALRKFARLLVPQRFRQSIRTRVEAANKKTYTPSAEELDMLRVALRDEIKACVADPDIPTEGWSLALGR